MSYHYQKEKAKIFTPEGVEMLRKIEGNVNVCLSKAGAIRSQEAFTGVCGDSWLMLACLDYLVETNCIREITKDAMGQRRIFVRAGE